MTAVDTRPTLASGFLAAFRSVLLSDRQLAENLQGAASGYVLRPWTELLTTAVARVCADLGWVAGAKGVRRSPLPYPRFECLGLDVTAFELGSGWRPPVAAFELENANALDKVGYALWKVACVRTRLAGLFCFRRDPERVPELIGWLADEVMASLPEPEGELLVVVGTRSAADTFPDGYFRPFEWGAEARRFRTARLGRVGR